MRVLSRHALLHALRQTSPCLMNTIFVYLSPRNCTISGSSTGCDASHSLSGRRLSWNIYTGMRPTRRRRQLATSAMFTAQHANISRPSVTAPAGGYNHLPLGAPGGTAIERRRGRSRQLPLHLPGFFAWTFSHFPLSQQEDATLDAHAYSAPFARVLRHGMGRCISPLLARRACHHC